MPAVWHAHGRTRNKRSKSRDQTRRYHINSKAGRLHSIIIIIIIDWCIAASAATTCKGGHHHHQTWSSSYHETGGRYEKESCGCFHHKETRRGLEIKIESRGCCCCCCCGCRRRRGRGRRNDRMNNITTLVVGVLERCCEFDLFVFVLVRFLILTVRRRRRI